MKKVRIFYGESLEFTEACSLESTFCSRGIADSSDHSLFHESDDLMIVAFKFFDANENNKHLPDWVNKLRREPRVVDNNCSFAGWPPISSQKNG